MKDQPNENPFLFPALFSGVVGLIAFGLLMVLGDFGVSPAAFLAILVAAATFIALLWGFSAKTTTDREAVVAEDTVSVSPAVTSGHEDVLATVQAVETAPDAPEPMEAASDDIPTEVSADPAVEAEQTTSVDDAVASSDVGANEDYDGDGVVEGTDEGIKPEMLSEAREGGPDNLKEIKGVGPAMEKLLHELGVFHFDQVASWKKDEVAWVDANLKGFKGRVSRDNWVDQAKTLAAGGETEFSKRVEEGDVY